MSNNSETTTLKLPKYVVEKVNGVWEVYNTELAVVEDVFKTEEEANTHLKQLLNDAN